MSQSQQAGAAAVAALSREEQRAVVGGNDIVKHLIKRAIDCLIDDWNDLAGCFRAGRAAAG